jgi:hypothetical protein
MTRRSVNLSAPRDIRSQGLALRRASRPAVFLLLLAACAPTYTTDLRAALYGPEVMTVEQASAAEAWLVDLFVSLGYDRAPLEGCVAQAQVFYQDEPTCNSLQKCGGWDAWQLLIVRRYECGWDEAALYSHELAHWLQECSCLARLPDWDHEQTGIWDGYGNHLKDWPMEWSCPVVNP